MIRKTQFKDWLKKNTSYTDSVISDTVSRMKRADKILEWYDDEIYLFYLEREKNFQLLNPSVRSQLKKAIKLYNEFQYETN